MAKRKKSLRRKQKANAKLATLFKMSREQLQQRKMTGGGPHRTRRDMPRAERERRAVNDQTE